MVKQIEWTADKIAELSLQQVRNVRANAERLKNAGVVGLCDAEIARRSPQRRSAGVKVHKNPAQQGEIVKGFHFVCKQGDNVNENPDGTFWTGSWVVDADHVKRGIDVAAYVALHASRATPSYRQGTIKEWRKAPRDRGKNKEGIEFLVQPTDEPLQWVGRGSAEKGYARATNRPT